MALESVTFFFYHEPFFIAYQKLWAENKSRVPSAFTDPVIRDLDALLKVT